MNDNRIVIESSSKRSQASNHENSQVKHPWLQKLISVGARINFFESNTSATNPDNLRTQIIATRVFVLVFIISVIVLLIYTAMVKNVHQITFDNPDYRMYQQLYIQYSDSLKCPCKHISMDYEKLLKINYSFHQVCDSFYISDEWIAYIRLSKDLVRVGDFRSVGLFLFRAIRSLCELSNDTIRNSLKQLLSSQYISDVTVPHDLFVSQVNSTIQLFLTASINNFLLSLRMIKETSHVNALISATLSNYYLYLSRNAYYVDSVLVTYDNGCGCSTSSDCISALAIYENNVLTSAWNVTGLFRGCFMLEALRQSSLECFYNEQCLMDLNPRLYPNHTIDLAPMIHSIKSHFYPTTKLGVVIDELMVDSWNWTIYHDEYYAACQPLQCTYTVIERNDLITIVTTMLGLIGGLVTILKLIIPRVVWLIRWKLKRRMRPSSSQTFVQRLRSLIRKVYQYLMDMNLFYSTPASTDDYELKTQLITTKAYLSIYSILLIILTIYSFAVTKIFIITIPSPNLEEYQALYQEYSQTLSCPCKQISISYENVTNINFTLHQVCYSFFVSNEWIQALENEGVIWIDDFRLTSIFMFQALHSFCQLAEKTIRLRLIQFYSSYFTSNVVTPKDVFRSQFDNFIEEHIAITTNNFLFSLRTIRNLSQINAIISALQTNYLLYRIPYSIAIGSTWVEYDDNCTCAYSTACFKRSTIYEDQRHFPKWHVPGFYEGCFFTEALRHSSLECFYNGTCLLELLLYMNLSLTTSHRVLNGSTISSFYPTTKLGVVIDELMVDSWNWTINHDQYYAACQPLQCTYTVIERNDLITIVTNMLGLIGGLVTILKLIIPRVVWLIRWKLKRRMRPSSSLSNVQQKILRIFRQCVQSIRNWNIFPSDPPATNHRDLRQQIISTRISIVIFILCLILLVVYASTDTFVSTVTVENPDIDQYNELYDEHSSQRMICPCKKISTSYKTFIHINYSLHSVCSSFYVEDQWIFNLQNSDETLIVDDFRRIGPYLFQSLRSLCQLAEESIQVNLARFYSIQYVSAMVTPKDLFESQATSFIQQFISATNNSFLLLLRTVRDTSQVNGLLSAQRSNCYLHRSSISNYVVMQWMKYGNNCRCDLDDQCFAPSVVYNNTLLSSTWNVPGFYFGCYMMEALLQSRLECLYNETCLEDLHFHLNSNTLRKSSPLNLSANSYFQTNTTVEEILNNLMIDQWRWSIDRDEYFASCQVSSCSYMIIDRNNIIMILTKIFSFTGGLMTTIRMIIPRIVKFVMKCIDRRKNKILPIIHIDSK